MRKVISASISGDFKKTAADSFGQNIHMLDIDRILPNEKNIYSVTDIDILAEDIERQGLRQNLVVAPSGDGVNYVIIGGHRRYTAVKQLREQGKYKSRFLPCIIENTDISEDEKVRNLIMLNAATRVISESEKLAQYEQLRLILEHKKEAGELHGRIRERIAAELKISTGQVSKFERVAADPGAKEAVYAGRSNIARAYDEIADTRKRKTRGNPFSHKSVIDSVKTAAGKAGISERKTELLIRYVEEELSVI